MPLPQLSSTMGNLIPYRAPFWPLDCIGRGGEFMIYLDLVTTYRGALSLWSKVRFLYSPAAPEVIAAAAHLTALEEELKLYTKQPALAA